MRDVMARGEQDYSIRQNESDDEMEIIHICQLVLERCLIGSQTALFNHVYVIISHIDLYLQRV